MQPNRIQERIIDVIGGALVAACVTGFFWSLATGSEVTRAETTNLTRAIGKASRDVRTLRAQAMRLQEVLSQRRTELKTSGQLPTHAPVEEYFQMLSGSATNRGLRVLRHNPLSEEEYPGLLEQRYLFEVAGSTENLIRFLEMIEQSDYWADVSYLTIDGESRTGGSVAARQAGVSGPGTQENTRQATLTISLFSAPTSASQQSPTPSPPKDT